MASQSKDHGDHGQKEEVSLTTLLSATQRTELIILLATVTATMREAIENNFEASVAAGPQKPEPENATEETSKDAAAKDLPAQDPNAPNPNADAKDVDASYREQEQRLLALRERELSEPKIKELKDAALKFFDAWRETMIKRVGEVVNPPAKATAQLGNPSAAIAAPSPAPDTTAGASKAQDESTALHKLYPPVPTPLAALEENSRILILHSMLLLLLSLEHYTAPSRILLLYLASALHLPLCTLRTIEESTAHSLLTTTKALWNCGDAGKSPRERKVTRLEGRLCVRRRRRRHRNHGGTGRPARGCWYWDRHGRARAWCHGRSRIPGHNGWQLTAGREPVWGVRGGYERANDGRICARGTGFRIFAGPEQREEGRLTSWRCDRGC